jgi:predicted negative regulator of RcsB-dependent stress response
MAIEILDEHEQSERVRAWLKDNGSNLITGIALGIALVAGWHWWQGSRQEHRITAAVQYRALVDAVGAKEADSVDAIAKSLQSGYKDSPYALMATMELARVKLDAGDQKAALQALSGIDLDDHDPALAAIVSLRAARLEIALGEPAKALARVERLAPAYAALADETRADALLALGRKDEARSAYEKALTQIDAGSPLRAAVDMKLRELGVSAEPEA